jgi:hypothetical protein
MVNTSQKRACTMRACRQVSRPWESMSETCTNAQGKLAVTGLPGQREAQVCHLCLACSRQTVGIHCTATFSWQAQHRPHRFPEVCRLPYQEHGNSKEGCE